MVDTEVPVCWTAFISNQVLEVLQEGSSVQLLVAGETSPMRSSGQVLVPVERARVRSSGQLLVPVERARVRSSGQLLVAGKGSRVQGSGQRLCEKAKVLRHCVGVVLTTSEVSCCLNFMRCSGTLLSKWPVHDNLVGFSLFQFPAVTPCSQLSWSLRYATEEWDRGMATSGVSRPWPVTIRGQCLTFFFEKWLAVAFQWFGVARAGFLWFFLSDVWLGASFLPSLPCRRQYSQLARFRF